MRDLNDILPPTPKRTDILLGLSCRTVQPHHEYWNRLVCSMTSIRTECATTPGVSRTVSYAAIATASLDTAAQRCMVTVVCAMTKPNTGVALHRLLDQSRFYVHHWLLYTCLEAPRRMHVACLHSWYEPSTWCKGMWSNWIQTPFIHAAGIWRASFTFLRS